MTDLTVADEMERIVVRVVCPYALDIAAQFVGNHHQLTAAAVLIDTAEVAVISSVVLAAAVVVIDTAAVAVISAVVLAAAAKYAAVHGDD